MSSRKHGLFHCSNVHMFNPTYTYVQPNIYICPTQHIHMFNATYTYVQPNIYICGTPHPHHQLHSPVECGTPHMYMYNPASTYVEPHIRICRALPCLTIGESFLIYLYEYWCFLKMINYGRLMSSSKSNSSISSHTSRAEKTVCDATRGADTRNGRRTHQKRMAKTPRTDGAHTKMVCAHFGWVIKFQAQPQTQNP